MQLAALATACTRKGASLPIVLDQLAKDIPGLLQERPGADEGVIPPLPIDPVTGQRVRNPWLEPHDFVSQNVIRETYPRQAQWLEDCARNGGPTAAMLDKLEFERREAEQLRTTPYGDKEWQANKLLPGHTVTEQNLFVKAVEDPWLLKLHRQEAKAGSPSLKFDNLTVRMKIASRSPEIREIHKAAGELYASWKAEAQEKAA